MMMRESGEAAFVGGVGQGYQVARRGDAVRKADLIGERGKGQGTGACGRTGRQQSSRNFVGFGCRSLTVNSSDLRRCSTVCALVGRTVGRRDESRLHGGVLVS
jgi:hypothetical protein